MKDLSNIQFYKKDLLSLARASVVDKDANISELGFDYLFETELANLRNGIFVTINIQTEKAKALRGCIGNFLSRTNILNSIVDLARSSAYRDFRFHPVRSEEIEELIFEITILTKPVKVASWKDIVLGRDGIILSYGPSSSVFLPQVAVEQGWDIEQTLSALANKAGLYEEIWKDAACEFEVFQGLIISEDDVK